MGGGLIQLATKGAQDVYLTGQPSVTFFKTVYKRHTNFARETIPISADKPFDNGSKVTFTIPRNADMIGSMYLSFKTNETRAIDGLVKAGQYDGKIHTTDSMMNNPIFSNEGTLNISGGFNCFGCPTIVTQLEFSNSGIVGRTYSTYINYIDILIGDQLIDRQYGEFLDMWHDLTVPESKQGGEHYNSQHTNIKDNAYSMYQSFTTGTNEFMGNVNGPCNYSKFTENRGLDGALYGTGSSQYNTNSIYVNIPLNFWFNKNTAVSLPLIALQYHQVKIEVNFKERQQAYIYPTRIVDRHVKIYNDDKVDDTLGDKSFINTLGKAIRSDGAEKTVTTEEQLYVDFFYLDSPERDIFANEPSHEYLIEQVQFAGEHDISNEEKYVEHQIPFTFNNPVKEIIWTCKEKKPTDPDEGTLTENIVSVMSIDNDDSRTIGNDPYQKYRSYYHVGGKYAIDVESANLFLNGQKFTEPLPGLNFNYVEPLKFHTNIPQEGYIYIHSFALRPEEYQPSGTCNFSRIDSSYLNIKSGYSGLSSINIYATNYNILKIQSGMAGLAFNY
mgnify:CR=1 FL=1|jgi:hypothetical protein|tara:strand:- start:24377 stop:26044 length:1668 start_codon:yes stop_codon:yes gene_type:complete